MAKRVLSQSFFAIGRIPKKKKYKLENIKKKMYNSKRKKMSHGLPLLSALHYI